MVKLRFELRSFDFEIHAWFICHTDRKRPSPLLWVFCNGFSKAGLKSPVPGAPCSPRQPFHLRQFWPFWKLLFAESQNYKWAEQDTAKNRAFWLTARTSLLVWHQTIPYSTSCRLEFSTNSWRVQPIRCHLVYKKIIGNFVQCLDEMKSTLAITFSDLPI